MTKAERTRQFIIEQSAPIFNIKGVAGTAMSDIMEATKLAKGSLYVHFESKEELSYCAVDYNLSLFSTKINGVLNRQKTAKAKLLALIDIWNNPMSPAVPGGCPLLNFGMEADDTNPIIRDKIDKGIQYMLERISGLASLGIAQGEFKKDWNAKEFATKTFAMIEGGVLISRMSGNAQQMKVILNIIKNEIEEKSI